MKRGNKKNQREENSHQNHSRSEEKMEEEKGRDSFNFERSNRGEMEEKQGKKQKYKE